MATHDTHGGAPTADEVAALADRLRRTLDSTPPHMAFVPAMNRHTVVQLYRYLSAYVALLQRQEGHYE